MKHRIRELGDAINQTLSNSEQIADIIARIKAEGYDVFLVLEATVGLNRRDGQELDEATPDSQAAELEINAQDLRFLKSLRISMDDQQAA